MIWIAITLMVVGTGLRAWGWRTIDCFTLNMIRPERITDTGPYKWIRHPMYTGNMIFMAGLLMISVHAAVALIAWSICLARATTEEGYMMGMPGYQDYYNRTGRFLPRLRSNRHGNDARLT